MMVRVVVLVVGSLRPSRGRRSNLYFSDTVLHSRVRNISHAPIQYIWCTGSLLLDCDVSGTYWAGILGGRPLIRMYVARNQKEPELCTVRSSTYRLCGRVKDQFSRCELTRGRSPLRRTAHCQDNSDLDLLASFVV